MILFIFATLTIFMIIVQYRRERNLINLITLLMGPYVFITLGNNLFAYKMGFNKISEEVLQMLLAAFVCFFIGSLLVMPRAVPLLYEEDNSGRFEEYRMSSMTKVLFIIGLVGMFKLVYSIGTGTLRSSIMNDTDDIMGGGIVGHLLLLSYSITPIVFLYWIENKKRILSLISILMIFAVTFSSFVKYNIIGLAVSLFIFTLMYKKSILKRAVIMLIVFSVVAFVGNYAITFWIYRANVATQFYFNHLWIYTSGSVIYDNYIFTSGLHPELSIFYKLGTFLMAFPNMFIQRFSDGFKVFPHIKKDFLPIGKMYGQTSNVTDAIGYIYPSKGNVFDIACFLIIMFLIGIIFSHIYSKGKRRKNRFDTVTCNFLTYFVFFSFFGTFYINPGPWEMLVYSAIIPKLFLVNTNLRKGTISL